MARRGALVIGIGAALLGIALATSARSKSGAGKAPTPKPGPAPPSKPAAPRLTLQQCMDRLNPAERNLASARKTLAEAADVIDSLSIGQLIALRDMLDKKQLEAFKRLKEQLDH